MDPAIQEGPVTVYVGDALPVLREMPSESVHCVVTSPPYWGLRDYGTAQWEGGDAECDHMPNLVPVKLDDPGIRRLTLGGGKGTTTAQAAVAYRDLCGKCGARRIDSQLGLEPTPEEFVANMVALFREVRRVLRSDGTCWVNLGDSYAQTTTRHRRDTYDSDRWGQQGEWIDNGRTTAVAGLKPKDLVGIPWRVALALQADGWYLRSDIVWSKPNPMPESVTDRPTKAHEYVFLLTKSARYFYDADAVREAAEYGRRENTSNSGSSGIWSRSIAGSPVDHRQTVSGTTRGGDPTAGRNLRSVWTIVTQPYAAAHFATFPEDLVIPCIKAGTSEHGCCPECGAPWRRCVEVRPEYREWAKTQRFYGAGGNGSAFHEPGTNSAQAPPKSVTTGWQPTCTHGRDSIPCTVLDPFVGSGTTLAVARRLGRRSVGIELSAEYLPLIRQRIEEHALPLLEFLQGQA